MKKNMGRADRLLRTLAGAAIVFFFLNGAFQFTLGIVLLVIAGVFIITSFIGVCPLYSLLGVNTCAKQK